MTTVVVAHYEGPEHIDTRELAGPRIISQSVKDNYPTLRIATCERYPIPETPCTELHLVFVDPQEDHLPDAKRRTWEMFVNLV